MLEISVITLSNYVELILLLKSRAATPVRVVNGVRRPGSIVSPHSISRNSCTAPWQLLLLNTSTSVE